MLSGWGSQVNLSIQLDADVVEFTMLEGRASELLRQAAAPNSLHFSEGVI